MQIKDMSIRDFRSHENTEIEFHPRLNIFLGANGTGKSSIRDAISVLLCGRTPDLAFEGQHGKANLNKIIREGTSAFHLDMNTDLGRHQGHGAEGRLSLNNQPEILRDRALWALAPAMFFDAPSAKRDQIIAEISGVDFKQASGLLEGKAKKLGLQQNYSDWYIMDLSDLQRKIKRFEEDRRRAKKEMDGLAQFRDMALPEGISQDHLMEYRHLQQELTAWQSRRDELEKKIPDIRKSLESLKIKDDPAALEEELKKEQKELILLRSKHDYIKAGKCPLDMDCDKLKDKEKMAEYAAAVRQAGIQCKARVAELEARFSEASNRNALTQSLAAMEKELGGLVGQEAEMAKKRERYTQLVELDAFEKLDTSKKKQQLEQAENQYEALDELLTYVHKELLPVAMGASAKFQEIISGLSPFPVTYKDGEFLLNGRPYDLLSASQRYRCQIALAEALSGNLGFVVLDGFELLDNAGQMMELGPAMKDEYRQTIALVGYTKKLQMADGIPYPVEPLKPPKPEVGRMFWVWLEQGITRIRVIQ